MSEGGFGPRRLVARFFVALATLLFGRRRDRRTLDEPGQMEPPRERVAETAELETRAERRAEAIVAACLAGATAAALAFAVLYVVAPNTQLLGLSIGLALAFAAAASIVAGKRVVPQETAVEERAHFGDVEEQRDIEDIVGKSATGVSRRRLLVAGAGVAGATIGGAFLLPAASLGPNVDGTIHATPWRRGRRVVDEHNRPIVADSIEDGALLTGFPEGAERSELAASVVIVRVRPDELALPADRAAFAPEGIVAYSKICPHAGCAVSMYRYPLHQPTSPRPALVCPCHYSTFDPARAGRLLFGPAGRDLPQLPLLLNGARELVAGGDFSGAVGPSYGGIRRRPRS